MPTDEETKGRWTPVFKFNNVPVHVTLLPNGKVLHWGRRRDPTRNPQKDALVNNLDEHFTDSYLWNPPRFPAKPVQDQLFGTDELIASQPQYFPQNKSTLETVSLFCSGHALLSSGDVFVAGGHLEDSSGANSASIFRWNSSTWETKAKMNAGRWYPSVLTLPDGRILVAAGTNEAKVPNTVAQIYDPKTDVWSEVETFDGKDAYPRMHFNPKNGQVFFAGPRPDAWFLQLRNGQGAATEAMVENKKGVFGQWIDLKNKRSEGARDYCPSIMYTPGNVMYIGGGNGDGEPSKATEFIDLTKDSPMWNTKKVLMNSPRRQFNATLLPDGSVLVTGGSMIAGFNEPGTPAKTAERMKNPSVDSTWDVMAEEINPRCYHSVGLLLPDGRVLSAGGGEYGGVTAAGCLMNGQLYEPPYFFVKNSTRPSIASAPTSIEYNKDFEITLDANVTIKQVSWMRLGSVTHCRNMSQSYMTLTPISQNGVKLTVRAPENSKVSPPGYYMLFVLNTDLVPSEAKFISIQLPPTTSQPLTPAPAPAQGGKPTFSARMMTPSPQIQPTLHERDATIASEQTRPPVAIGITPLCPYGLGTCWGSAFKGLQEVSDIDVVRPMPHHDDSLAYVYIREDVIPDIDVWRREFEATVNKSYDIRGIEITVSGTVTKKTTGTEEQLTLASTSTRPELILAPFQTSSQLKWDMQTSTPKPITEAETGAYEGLFGALSGHMAGVTVQVTGTLQKHDDNKFSLDVREYKLLDTAASGY